MSETTAELLPGMPDRLAAKPPKAEEYEALTLDEAIVRAHAILDRVLAGVVIERITTKPADGSRPTTITTVLGPDAEVTKPTRTTDATTGDTVIATRKRLQPPEQTFTLFSGGGDSSVLAHLMRERTNTFAHVRTGISVPATWEYVQAVCGSWNAQLTAAYPDVAYQDLVMGRVAPRTPRGKREAIWKGFPGPAGHTVMYQQLKERALAKLRSDVVGRRGRTGQLAFLAGMRWAESDRRFRNAEEADLWGSVIWCSPIVWWTNAHMREYRDRFMCHDSHEHAPHRLCFPGALPLSEVTEHLHMSGDCLCGAYAKPGELDMIELFYPAVAARLRALESEATTAGLERCIWGEGKRPGEPEPDGAPGPLCKRCVPPMEGQLDITDNWFERGLITAEQYEAMRSAA